MKTKLFKLLPEKTRAEYYRNSLHIDELDSDYEFKIASTKDELESAYKLLHDIYVQKKIMDPDPSGLRCTFYSALPFTSVIIAKYKRQVVGTVSVIKDSPIGFPSDKDYKKENDDYRDKGFSLCEISALAVTSEHRKKKTGSLISLYLMKYVTSYALNNMKCDMHMATVHPSTLDFYKFILNYCKNGKVIKYKFVNGALAIHITANYRNKNHQHWAKEQFNELPASKNMYRFLYVDNQKAMHFPQMKNDFLLQPVMTLELLKYFFTEKTQLFRNLSIEELRLIKSAYSSYFDLSQIDQFRFVPNDNRHFRFLSHFETSLYLNNQLYHGVIYDISLSGAYISIPQIDTSLPKNGDTVVLHFNLNNQIQEIKGIIVRENITQNLRSARGVGIQFNENYFELLNAIHSMHLNYEVSPKESGNIMAFRTKRKVI